MSNKGFNKQGKSWYIPEGSKTIKQRALERIELSRPLHNGKPNMHAYWEDGEWHYPLMWGKAGHYGFPKDRAMEKHDERIAKMYAQMEKAEADLKLKQVQLKTQAAEVKLMRDIVIQERLKFVNRGFKKPDGGPIRNKFAGVNKGTYKDSCNECLDKGECGSSDGCCNCICHKGTRQDWYNMYNL